MARAIGDIAPGACTTTAIAWHHAKPSCISDPAVGQPIDLIKARFRLWEDLETCEQHKVRRLWDEQRKELSKSRTKRLMARGSMTAAIATMLDLGCVPERPNEARANHGPTSIKASALFNPLNCGGIKTLRLCSRKQCWHIFNQQPTAAVARARRGRPSTGKM